MRFSNGCCRETQMAPKANFNFCPSCIYFIAKAMFDAMPAAHPRQPVTAITQQLAAFTKPMWFQCSLKVKTVGKMKVRKANVKDPMKPIARVKSGTMEATDPQNSAMSVRQSACRSFAPTSVSGRKGIRIRAASSGERQAPEGERKKGECSPQSEQM